MAGLQHCYRKLLIYNTSRLINRNGLLFQPSRSRHHLILRIASPRKGMSFQKTKLLCSADRQQNIFRLASTNVNTSKEAVLPSTAKPETTAGQAAPSSNSGVAPTNEAGVVQSSSIIDETSLPPAPSTNVIEVPQMEFISLNLKEPTFESLGLGSWWPSGLIQQLYEYLHISIDMPWWQAIVVVTFATRLLLFPVNLSTRKDTINMMNHLPQIGQFQQKITEARASGDFYGAATASQEMQQFIMEKKINMFSFFKTAIIQGPIFISMFYALKGMANAPVESLKTGGLFWFTDLTETDPYYILPVLLSTSLFLIIELGAEGNPANASTHTVKWVLRGFPLVILVVSTNFSSCITWYWTISNFLSLCQAGLLKIPAVASFFKLPKAIKHDPKKIAGREKGFIEGFKEGFKNSQITAQIADRERINLMEFQKAGSGTIPRTFKRNPLLEKGKK